MLVDGDQVVCKETFRIRGLRRTFTGGKKYTVCDAESLYNEITLLSDEGIKVAFNNKPMIDIGRNFDTYFWTFTEFRNKRIKDILDEL